MEKRKNHAGTMSRFESTAYRTCAIRDRHPGLSCRKLVASLRRLSEIQALSGGSLNRGSLNPTSPSNFHRRVQKVDIHTFV